MVRRGDNFGVLRLVAATAVLVSHAFVLSGKAVPFISGGGEDLGDVAVAVFFAISGFLVAGSWSRDPNLWRFLQRRARRIWPGLTLAVLFTAYVLGPAFTRLPLGPYLGSAGTHAYVLAKLTMDPATNQLPGLFMTNVLHVANGSLWTLPIEVKAYILLAVLGVSGLLQRRWFVWAAWVVCVEVVVLFVQFGVPAGIHIWTREIYLYAVFLGGVALYRERERLPLRASFAAALVAAWLAARGTPLQIPLGAAAVPYACLWLAYRTRPVLVRFVRRTDLSYGMYLYGYPIEQAIRAALGRSLSPGATLALALPLSASLAFVSWHAVEKPFLRRKPAPEFGTDRESPVLVPVPETRT